EEVALAEIASHGATDPGEELDVERAVEPVSLADDLDIGLARRRAGDRNGEVARQPRQHECKRHHGKRDQKAESETPGNQIEHARSNIEAQRGYSGRRPTPDVAATVPSNCRCMQEPRRAYVS